MSKLKIIFAGTPQFAVPTLQKLIDSEYIVQAVFTQPDRPSGRGKKITASPVKALALKHNLPVHQPINLVDAETSDLMKSYDADLLIVVAYGLIIPQKILAIPKGGCLNVHASLLPKLRGAAPIQYSLLNGDKSTGISIMQMEKGLDTGPVLMRESIAIYQQDTSASLSEKLATLGSQLLHRTIEQYAKNNLHPKKQDNTHVTYAPKIDKSLAKINWHNSASNINLLIRALNPNPVAFSHINEVRVRIFGTQIVSSVLAQVPGTIIKISPLGIDVATQDNVIRILSCQLPGKKIIDAKEIFNAYQKVFAVGNIFN